MTTRHPLLLAAIPLTLLLSACASMSGENSPGTPSEVTAESYASRNTTGTVLLAANWGRSWGCGSYKNAQLISFSFDRLPLNRAADDPATDLVIGTANRLMVDPEFVNLAVSIPPGEYALSNVRIKVASGSGDVGYFVARRQNLIANGKPKGGTFKVAAGETVYIGNFGLDCLKGPILWRYYTKNQEGFRQHLAEYKEQYPFLDLSSVKYRLFETTLFGQHFELK